MTNGSDQVHEILKVALQVEHTAGFDESTALEDLPNMDSLAHMRLISELESRFGTPLTIDEILGLASVKDIRDLLKAKGAYAGS